MHGANVHIADRGTKFWARVRDEGENFDPSSATTKQLIFKLPDDTVEVRTAQAEQFESEWYLTYTIAANGDDDAILANRGQFYVQGYLDYGTSVGRWHSDEQAKDRDGKELIIYPNLRTL